MSPQGPPAQLISPIFHAGSICLAVSTDQGRYVDVNQAFASFFGYRREEVLGRNGVELGIVSEEQLEALGRLLDESGKVSYLDVPMKARDGTPREALVSVDKVAGDDGVRYITVLVDIADRRAAEERLRVLNRSLTFLSELNQALVRVREPEAQLQTICRVAVEKGGFAYAWIGVREGPDGAVRPVAGVGRNPEDLAGIHACRAAGKCDGCPVDRVVAQTAHVVRILDNPDIRPASCERAARELGMRAAASFPLGGARGTRGALTLYTDDPRRFADEAMVLLDEMASDASFALDLAEREMARRASQEALERSEARLRRAQALAHVGNWEIDLRSLTIWGSAEAFRIYGLSETEGTAPLRVAQDRVVPEDRARLDRALKDLLAGNKGYDEDFRITRASTGEMAHLHSTAEVVRDAEGKPVLVVGVVQDVTRERRLEDQIRQAQKLEAVGRLAGGVAHDFNNTIAVIQGYAELLAASLHTQDPLQEDVRAILEAAKRSAGLTRQLLTFARKQIIAPMAINLNNAIESLRPILARIAGEDIALHIRLDPELWLTAVDPTQVDQILTNLCTNARDAIQDTGTIRIETSNATLDPALAASHVGAESGQYVLLAFSDDGRGMDRETRARIFEPFFTTKAEGKGTGLGLSTVLGIVQQNGGFITVYSEPAGGTTFRVYLPRYRGTAPARREPAAAAALGGTETVLVVEDEADLLRLAGSILRNRGYRVLTASSPAEALHLCESAPDPIHLVVTDVVMPGMNGRDLAARLVAMRPGLKTLYTSGYTADIVAHRGIVDEGIQYLPKPYTIQTLAAKVREVLDG